MNAYFIETLQGHTQYWHRKTSPILFWVTITPLILAPAEVLGALCAPSNEFHFLYKTFLFGTPTLPYWSPKEKNYFIIIFQNNLVIFTDLGFPKK